MRFYISGAISRYRGRYDEIERQFGIIDDILTSRGFEVANPWKLAPYDLNKTWLDYMIILIPELLKSDVVVLRRDWILSRGARREFINAVLFNKEIVFERSIYRLGGLH